MTSASGRVRVLVYWSLFAVVLACRSQDPTTPAEPSEPRLLADEEAAVSRPEPAEVASPPEEAPQRPAGIIYRQELHRATGNGKAGYLMRQLKPVPHRSRGSFQGWRITVLFPDDPELCARCDLRVGDVILSVNGSRLERPEQLDALIEKIDTLEELHVRLIRDQMVHEARYRIVD